MRCQRIYPQLLAFLEGELSPSAHGTIAAHLAHCPACRAEVRGLQQTMRLVQALDVPEPGPAFWTTFETTLQQRLRRAAEPQPWYAPLQALLRIPKPVFAAVAVCLIVVGSLPLLYGPRHPQVLPPVELSSGEETSHAADITFFQYLDLLEEVETLEHLDASL